MSRLPKQPVSSSIFRVCSQRHDPWALRPWASVGSDGTFGHRWDDPTGSSPDKFRVVYAATTRAASFAETLQGFIPTAEMIALRTAIAYDPLDGPSSLPPGVIPTEWLADNIIGRAEVEAECASIGNSDALWYLHEQLAPIVLSLGYSQFIFDLSALFSRSPRRVSQEASRVVFEDTDYFAGIICPSRLGVDLLNVTLFEDAHNGVGTLRAPVTDKSYEGISRYDPDLLRAIEMLRLRIE